jgi:hypothetical protein
MSRTMMTIALAGVLASALVATNAQALGAGGGPGVGAVHPGAPIGRGAAPMGVPAAPRAAMPTFRASPPIGGAAAAVPCSAIVGGLRTNCF